MNIFYGTDITENKKNTDISGSEFSVQESTESEQNALLDAMAESDMLADKSDLPLPFIIIRAICLIAAIILVRGILKAKVSVAEAFKNAPAMFIIAAVCFCVWLILFIIGRRKAKQMKASDEYEQNEEKMNSIVAGIFRSFGVPADAVDIELLNVKYKRKNGITEIADSHCGNFAMRTFIQNGNLYFADTDNKYEIPLNSLQNIREENAAITLYFWKKDIPYNSPEYRQYKIRTDKYNRYHINKYYAVEFVINGEQWELYIPNYDIAEFEKLTGLKH